MIFFPVREFNLNALFISRIHYQSNIIFANSKWILFLFWEITIFFSHFELYVYAEYRVFIMNLLFLLCFHIDWFFNDCRHNELTILFAYHRLTLIFPSFKITNFYFLKLFRVIVFIFFLVDLSFISNIGTELNDIVNSGQSGQLSPLFSTRGGQNGVNR